MSQPRVLTNRVFQTTFFGAAGRTYVMEARTDAAPGPWLPIATNSAGPMGTWILTDPNATNFPRRLYRARLVE